MLKNAPPPKKPLPVGEAVAVLKTFNTTKFDQTVEIAMRWDRSEAGRPARPRLDRAAPRHRQVAARGGLRQRRQVDEAKAAGADEVGGPRAGREDQGRLDRFDVCIATPDMMGVVGPLGKVLGPRGLMPSPRAGTVTPDVGKAVQRVQGGQGRVPHQGRRRQHPCRRRQAQLRRPEIRRQHHAFINYVDQPEARRGPRAIHQRNRRSAPR